MDVLWFLKKRTGFILRYYETAVRPFEETVAKIEAGEAPFEPPYSEDMEPPFMEEWIEAQSGLQLVGMQCVSMLSDSLRLFFETWDRELGVGCRKRVPTLFKRRGYIHAYLTCLASALHFHREDIPVDLAIIEQVALARNTAQHPKELFNVLVDHPKHDISRYPNPFFVGEHERRLLEDEDLAQLTWLSLPTLHVTREKLVEASSQIEALAEWLDARIRNDL